MPSAADASPRICVVTPCLDAAATIDDTIASVVEQAGNFRIRYHVQDGGSRDATPEHLARWQERLQRAPRQRCRGVRFSWESQSDAGLYDAVGRGFDHFAAAAETILTWINADDVLLPGALATAAAIMGDGTVQWLGGPRHVIDETGAVLESRPLPTPARVIAEGLCDGRHWHHLQQEGMFFSRALWFRGRHVLAGHRLAGDWRLWREFARHAPCYACDRPLGAFRRRAGQLSVRQRAGYEAEIEAVLPAQTRRRAWRDLQPHLRELPCHVARTRADGTAVLEVLPLQSLAAALRPGASAS